MVDQIGIKVWPDSRGFRDDLRKSLARVEKQLKTVIPAAISLKRTALADLRRQLKSIEIDVPVGIDTARVREATREARETAKRATERDPVEIPAQLGNLDKRFIARLRRDAQKAADAAEATIPATIEGERLRQNLQSQLAKIEQQMKATIPVDPERAAAWRSDLKRMVDDINDQKAEITANVDLDRGLARAQLATLLRPRTIPISVSVSKSSLAAAGSAIAALSGLRVLGDIGSSVGNTLKNLDRITAKAAVLAPVILNLGAAALAGTSNLLALGASLSTILPAALALPGIFAGFGIGIGVMIAALADASTVLKDLGPGFSALQDTISTSFWEQAAQPIRDLANNVLPILNTRLGEIGGQLGSFFASMANAFNTPEGLAQLDAILVSIRDAIDIAAEGISWFTEGLLGLGAAGASYLPQLAGWFNRISESFAEWVRANTESGQLFAWIDAGVLALQDLGRVLGAVGGILGGFATAAANAGGANLGALADGLESINQAVNGPAFQGALTTVFQGAHDAMSALAPGVRALGDAFVALAPTLAEIMTLAGEIASVGLGAISAAFQDPTFQGGLTAFLDGVLVAVQGLAPAFPALAAAFGTVATLAGSLAAQLGPILGAAITALAPVVTQLATALMPLVPVLGEALLTAIQQLAPVLMQVATDLFPQLVAAIVQILPVIVQLIPPIVQLATTFLNVLIPAINALLPIVVAIVQGLGTQIQGIVQIFQGLLDFLIGVFTGNWSAAWEGIQTAFTGVWNLITGYAQSVIPVISNLLIGWIGPVVQAISSGLTAVQTWFVSVLTAVVTWVTTKIAQIRLAFSHGLNAVRTIVATVLATIRARFLSILAAIVAFVISRIAAIRTGFQNGLNAARAIVASVLAAIRARFFSILAAVVSFVVSRIAAIRLGFSHGLNAVRSLVSSVLGAIRARFAAILAAVVSIASSRIAAVVGFFRALPGRITGALSSLAGRLRTMGVQMMQGMVNGIKSMAGRLLSAARETVNGAINGAKSLLGINSPSRVFMEIGEYTGEGMIIGLEHRARAVNAAMTDMVAPPSVGDTGAPGGPMPGTASVPGDVAALTAQLLALLSQWEPIDDRGFLMLQRRAGRQVAR